mmetsp:Transcript_24552/g.24794  ORF Transcript_24552/g.24794 Transcript_24552/m.24794 type:complete len:376 (+) Transcript_24552:144-1271(+)|eukprot:CAMPEP_0182426056 /NCGR_PEP_ID=MMETSP1167-20130531/12537_1 /TAXON_ID=2988 /ORGANISM="Mallomonas Sp, Strain CCMP3275" /LENGTH=375 /DNA_ID=CAMNT_0024607221 /DNA_START=13 /DNA_END=1140 /DNA_ORIENTATION=-
MATITSDIFLTQRAEKINETKKEIAELEALLAGATQTSQSTLLLKKRKEMREVDEALELMKEEYKNRIDICEEKRQEFERKQTKMREQVLKFEKFIQENDAKRLRAEMKSKQERKFYEQKCQELSTLALKIDELGREQRNLDAELERRSCFRQYLERVIEVGDHGYEEITDLLNRYKTLQDANNDLMKQVETYDTEIDILRQKLDALKMNTQNQLLVSNSNMQRRQKDLEDRRQIVKNEEEEKNLQEESKKNIVRETGQVVQAIKNIFARCQATMRIKPQIVQNRDNDLSDLLAFDLDVVHARILDLKEICDEFKTAATVAAANNVLDHNMNKYESGQLQQNDIGGVSVSSGTNTNQAVTSGTLLKKNTSKMSNS